MVYKASKRKMILFGFVILCNIAMMWYFEHHWLSKKISRKVLSFYHDSREYLDKIPSKILNISRDLKRNGISITEYHENDNDVLLKNIEIIQSMNKKYSKTFNKSAANKVSGANMQY